MKTRIRPKKNSNLALYVALLLAAIIVMVTLKTCSRPHPLAPGNPTASGGDTIDVAIDYAPLSFYRYGDTLVGFNYEVMKGIAADNGLHLKFHPVVSLRQAMEGLDDGLYDILVADLPVTTDFKERYIFSEPVYHDRQVLVQLRDSAGRTPVSTQLDLAGKEVWVAAHSPIVKRLENLSSEIGDTIYVREDGLYGAEQLFLLVATGEAPFAVINERTAMAMATDYPEVDISTEVSFTQFQSWLMNKSDSMMMDSVNRMLLRFKDTPSYRRIYDKYF